MDQNLSRSSWILVATYVYLDVGSSDWSKTLWNPWWTSLKLGFLDLWLTLSWKRLFSESLRAPRADFLASVFHRQTRLQSASKFSVRSPSFRDVFTLFVLYNDEWGWQHLWTWFLFKAKNFKQIMDWKELWVSVFPLIFTWWISLCVIRGCSWTEAVEEDDLTIKLDHWWS